MIQSAYGIGRSVIERCFPPPAVSHPSCKGGKIVRLWTRSQVEQGLSHPQVVAALERSEKKSARQLAEQLQIREYLLTFDNLIDTSPESGLVYRPLSPRLECTLYLTWSRFQNFSPIAERFLKQIRTAFQA